VYREESVSRVTTKRSVTPVMYFHITPTYTIYICSDTRFRLQTPILQIGQVNIWTAFRRSPRVPTANCSCLYSR